LREGGEHLGAEMPGLSETGIEHNGALTLLICAGPIPVDFKEACAEREVRLGE
jgi:hypothetical protein